MRTALKLSLIILAGLAISSPANAYIDPNAGGLIFQLVTPILAIATAAVTFAGRQIYSGFVAFFRAVKYLLIRVFRASNQDFE